MIIRHVGSGGKAVLAQFLKSSSTGELASLSKLDVPIYRNTLPHGFFPSMNTEMKESVTKMHNETLQTVTQLARSNQCTLLVLDELCAALSLEVVDHDSVISLIKNHGDAELVITGRDPSEELLSFADYITEMKLVRHPFTKGVKARKGIEF